MANTTLTRTQLLFPAVGDTGWGTAFNSAMTTADARIAVLASGSDNVFANKNEFQDTVTFTNATALDFKDSGGTARRILIMTGGDSIQLGTSANALDITPKEFVTFATAPTATQGALDIGGQGPGALAGAHIKFTEDSSLADGSSVDGQLWFTGTVLKLNVAGVVKTIDMT